MDEIENWLTRDLHERRYITVVDNVDLQAEHDPTEPGPTAWPMRVELLQALTFALPVSLALHALLSLTGRQKPSRAEGQNGQVSILRVPRSSVGDIDFGASGWEPGVVYAVNPKQPTMYRPLATFHEEMLLHKLTELDRLLNALGAKEYEISHVRRRGRRGEASLGLGSLFDLGGATGRTAFSERHWSGTSEGHEPHLPEKLCWYAREREWQNLAESRMQGSRLRFAFSVRQDEDFGVDARLAASVEAAKLKIGGRYTSVDHVEFAVAGTF